MTPHSPRSLLNEISILEQRVHELRHSGAGGPGAAGEDAAAERALKGAGGPRGQIRWVW